VPATGGASARRETSETSESNRVMGRQILVIYIGCSDRWILRGMAIINPGQAPELS